MGQKLILCRDAFDPDVKSLVKVKVVHGSWKRDDPQRIRLEVSVFRTT